MARTPARRRVLAWLPTIVIALVCAGFVAGAIVMQGSWWTRPDAAPAADQRAPDGMSRFDRAGVDYLTRDGILRVKLRSDAAPASALGLPADGSTTVTPLVPVTAIVIAPDGPFVLESVDAVVLETVDDRVTSVRLSPADPGTWQSAFASLREIAATWGWTDADLQKLTGDVAQSSRASTDEPATASLPRIPARGALVSADVTVEQGGVVLGLTVSDPELAG